MIWLKIVYMGCALIFCTIPANLFIRWFMKTTGIVVTDCGNNDDLLRA